MAAVLAKAALYAGPAEIVINGMCREAVILTRSNTTLRGGTPGSGLNPGTGCALEVTEAQNIRLWDLTLTGAQTGLCGSSAAINLFSSSIVGNSESGIMLGKSTLSLRPEGSGNIVDGNGRGIMMSDSSSLWVDGSMITNNHGDGLTVLNGSSAAIHATRIAGNSQDGINLYFSCTLSVQAGSVLEGNTSGIAAMGGSTMVLGDGVVIQLNSRDGIRLSDTSVAAAFGSPSIQNNEGFGVVCAGSPAVAQLATSTFGTVENNRLGNIECPRPQ